MAKQDSSETRPLTRLQAARNAAAAAAAALPPPAEPQTRRITRQAAKQSSATSADSRSTPASTSSSTRQQEEDDDDVVLHMQRLSNEPSKPEYQQHLPRALQAMADSQLLSSVHANGVHAVFAVACGAPHVLLQAVLAEVQAGPPRSLYCLLETMHIGFLPGHEAALSLLSITTAALQPGPTSAAASALSAALLSQQQGSPAALQHLLRAMQNSDGIVAYAAAATISSLSCPALLRAGPEAAALAGAWLSALLQPLQGPQQRRQQQQQQCVQLVLQALEHAYAPAAESAGFIMISLALASPARMLAALLSPAARRDLHIVVRTLDSSNPQLAQLAAESIQALTRAADSQQLRVLLQHLVRAVEHRNIGAARLLEWFTQLVPAHPHLLQHMQLLAQLLEDREQDFQTAGVIALWKVLAVPDEAAAAVAAQVAVLQGLTGPLLRCMMQQQQLEQDAADEEWSGWFRSTCGFAISLLARNGEGRRLLIPHIGQLLEASQAHQPTDLTRHAMRTVLILASDRTMPAALEAVQQHAAQITAIMLQRDHADTAFDAGDVVMELVHSEAGLQLMSQQQHIDSLLHVMEQQGPALPHAATAVAHIADAGPETASMLAASPFWQAAMHAIWLLLPKVEALAAGQEGAVTAAVCDAFGPVYWAARASAACELVPCFLGRLVLAMKHVPMLVVPGFDALRYLALYRKGRLALAPHVLDLEAVVRARIAEPFSTSAAMIEVMLSDVVAGVRGEVGRVRQEQCMMAAKVQDVAVQLAQAHARYRRRPRTEALQAGAVVVLLQRLGQLSDQNDELLQQLCAVGSCV